MSQWLQLLLEGVSIVLSLAITYAKIVQRITRVETKVEDLKENINNLAQSNNRFVLDDICRYKHEMLDEKIDNMGDRIDEKD